MKNKKNIFCYTEIQFFYTLFIATLLLSGCQQEKQLKIDRKAVVNRHRIVIRTTNPQSPSQVGNGKFAFGMDITGLQTFIPFNTLSDWSWHSFPLPPGTSPEDFKETYMETHGRQIPYPLPNPEQPELSAWLSCNPHRFNPGRIGFKILKSDGQQALENDLQQTVQEVNLWTGLVTSRFELEGKEVIVETVCHPVEDIISVRIHSSLMETKQLAVFVDFPYPDGEEKRRYLGDYAQPGIHTSRLETITPNYAIIHRTMDDTQYQAALQWQPEASFQRESGQSHRFYLEPEACVDFSFSCAFFQKENHTMLPAFAEVQEAGKKSWEEFWLSGAALDLSGSTDNRWQELERRIVLSQYLMRLNEAGLYPPQEAGLVNNGWYGRFHFEMIWWHGVHYGLWDRWELADNYLSIYRKFLPTSIERAANQGYKGARWPKCTAGFDQEWPHPIHATLIWQQPHPIYFAEMDYRLHPHDSILHKWKEIVFNTADFMADYPGFNETTQKYVLGPPLYIVSENTDMYTTRNPSFELSYWRYGLRTALRWSERLSLAPNPKWKEVLENLSPLPVQEGVYVTYEGIENMWTQYNFEHPALTGTYGILPGDGVDPETFRKTFEKVLATWRFDYTWGWDFPMMAMAAARTGNPDLAIDLLMTDAPGFQFDEHGLCTGGPFPYFPSNGGLLTAIAMMCGGWDGSGGKYPGFPKEGWSVRAEGFNKME